MRVRVSNPNILALTLPLTLTGARIGRALPPITYEWTLGLQPDGSWTVDRIVPEVRIRVG